MCHWNWKRISVETYEQIHWLSRYWRAFRDPICSYSRSSQRLHLQLHGVLKQTPSPLEPSESYSWPAPGFLKTYFFHTYLVLRQLRHHLQNIKIKFFWCLQFLSIISFLDFCCLQTSTREAQLHCIEKAIFFIVVKSLFRIEKFILDEIALGDT